jgi:hypothetical protein
MMRSPPFNERGDWRDHNPCDFTMRMAGGGVRDGQTIGATGEIGLRGVGERYHVHNIRASILDLLELHHERLAYTRNGRAERPTITSDAVIQNLTT